MSPLAALIALIAVAIPLAIVATTTWLDRRKARRAPPDYDVEGA